MELGDGDGLYLSLPQVINYLHKLFIDAHSRRLIPLFNPKKKQVKDYFNFSDVAFIIYSLKYVNR